MIKINEIIVVEGKYDSAAVKRCIDTIVLETGGFRIFKDPDLMNTIRILSEKRGLVILTDSDRAGFLIRNKILSFVDAKYVKNAYIPDIPGVERRKREPSKDGLLGVEGMTDTIIIDALKQAGVFTENNAEKKRINKSLFYETGLYGREDSSKKRLELKKLLGLPEYLSTNKLFEILCNI
jgi:ribonuclease M5